MKKDRIRKLSLGSIIEVIAPSRKCSDDRRVLEEKLNDVKNLIESWGFKAKINKQIYGEDIFYANNNFTRAKLLKEALISEESDAIWAVRGGSGATELISYLEGKVDGFEKLPEVLQKEKLLIGFSDITALHLFLNKKYDWQTLHAPVIDQLIENKISRESKNLLQSIISKDGVDEINYNLIPLKDCSSISRINAKIVGGNLTLVEKSLGTDWEIETANKILFIEEVNGNARQLERSLTHLIESSKLDNCAAVILGQFINIEDEELISQVQERFIQKFNEYSNLDEDIPIFKLNEVGHGYTNYPLPLNSDIEIIKNEDSSYTLHGDIY